jgi:dihydroorotate dehydrogenase electron transfer subunit
VEIVDTVSYNSKIKSITFKDQICRNAIPGQFVMVWVLGVDEIPLTLSTIDREEFSEITVKNVGEATSALYSKISGSQIGIRGPYGNGFTIENGNILLVGGGVGMATLISLIEVLTKKVANLTLIMGAKSKEDLVFLERVDTMLKNRKDRIIVTTDDGSYGIRGTTIKIAEKFIKKNNIDMIYTCGPEEMMLRLFKIADSFNIPLQASVERIMRCSIGICGSCYIGGFRTCIDGPVLNTQMLREVWEESEYKICSGKKNKQKLTDLF